MNQRCPVCDLKFEREQGYFLGAMYISYLLGIAAILMIGLVLWFATRWSITKDLVWAMVLFVPLAPTISLFSRVLWIYFDQAIDPAPRR